MKIDGKKIFSILLVTMLVSSVGIVVVQGSQNADSMEIMEQETEQELENEEETEIEDEDDDSVDDDFEDLNERKVQVELDENQIEIESILENGEKKDKIELKLEYNVDGLKIKLSYEEEYDEIDSSSELETEHELSIEVEFRELIEYIDTDENGMYNESIDQEIQVYNIDSFTTPIYSTISIDENSTLHYLNISTTDGIFTVHIYVAEEFTEVNTILITPTQTKIDIEIKDFNYLETDSQLALYTKLESEEEFYEESETDDEEHGYKNNESGIETIQNGFIGFFTWAESATIDGLEKEIRVSPVESDDDQVNEKVYINYPRGDLIYHDPTLGIANILLTPGTTNQLFPILIGVSAVLGVAIIAGVLIRTRIKRS